jgi:hypothetical protein|tara:strand:- start:845 stop:1123 length:279 start_codon:yes stop_codon:yes gene_type:complete
VLLGGNSRVRGQQAVIINTGEQSMVSEVEEFLADVSAFGVRHGWSDTRIGEEYGNRAIIHRARKGLEEGRVRVRRGTMLRVRKFMAQQDAAS